MNEPYTEVEAVDDPSSGGSWVDRKHDGNNVRLYLSAEVHQPATLLHPQKNQKYWKKENKLP